MLELPFFDAGEKRGPAGPPGPDSLPADAFVAALLSTDGTATNTALDVILAAYTPGGGGGGGVTLPIAQSDVSGLVAALGLLAPKASPALTGNPTAPTPTLGNGIAIKSYVDGLIAQIKGPTVFGDTLASDLSIASSTSLAANVVTVLSWTQPANTVFDAYYWLLYTGDISNDIKFDFFTSAAGVGFKGNATGSGTEVADTAFTTTAGQGSNVSAARANYTIFGSSYPLIFGAGGTGTPVHAEASLRVTTGANAATINLRVAKRNDTAAGIASVLKAGSYFTAVQA